MRQPPVISFQRIPNFVAPTWPEGPVPQQMHLDFDPIGHPFCLVLNQNVELFGYA